MLKKTFLGIGLTISFLSSFAVDINTDNLNLTKKELQIFLKAYQLGREDALKDFTYEKQKTLSLLKDVYITKKLIKEGDLKIIVKTQIQPIGDNEFRIVKVFSFKIIKPSELAKDKTFIKRIEEKAQVLDNYEGYWLYIKTDFIPEPIQGLIEYALLKEGFKPTRLGNVIVAKIFRRKSDAEMWQKLLKQKYNLDFAIGEVNKGKSLDPILTQILNSLQ
jgi:hypothetical protein